MPVQDAFYMLPDSLISYILSKIPIRDAVKCSVLSKRWRFLYTQMPTLTFSSDDLLGPDCHYFDPLTMSRVENIISNVLLLHSGDLEGFFIRGPYLDSKKWFFSSETVCKWVRYAALCNVQHLTLYHNAFEELPPPVLFSCSRLLTLGLTGYVLNAFPTNFVGFPHRTSCDLQDVRLTDESLVSLISLCPLLQKLEIAGARGLDNVVISSSTIEHLTIDEVSSLSVDCPKLKFMSGDLIEDLSVNGVRFHELSYALMRLKMHCGGSMRKLSIDTPRPMSPSRFLDILGNFQSLQELKICTDVPLERETGKDVSLLNLLHRLPNLQSLSLLDDFLQELARGPIPQCLASPHVNLKKICVEITEFDHKAIAVISCMLRSTPFLERMEITLFEFEDGNYKSQFMYFKDILYQRRASSQARIIVDIIDI